MKKINITLIRKLREKTGSGLLDCKKALIKANGDFQKSLDYLRTSGICVALKKSIKEPKIGKIFLYCNYMVSILIQLNAETDFVVKNNLFITLGNEIVKYAGENFIFELKEIRKFFDKKIIALINKVKENITLKKIYFLKGEYVSAYIHSGRIGVLLKWNSVLNAENLELGKKIAMHIAASHPLYLQKDSIPSEVFLREYNVQMELAKKTGKKSFLLEKIVKGRMKKFQNEYTLLEQNFIFSNKETVKNFLKNKNFIIKEFIYVSLKDK
ncbi:translation elongation factor Ts [Buchnera aphidicola]|uniref:translation elongation factor Ts n=1 Tax=Buchnera aphidicola TaxID=9 RepID=UPI0031B67880